MANHDELRSALYASLLKFCPEFAPLRERALDGVVTAALYGTNEEKPMKVGEIQAEVRTTSLGPEIRTDLLQESLNRLLSEGTIATTLVRKKTAYYLIPKGIQQVADAIAENTELIRRGIDRMMQHLTAETVDQKIGREICQRFMAEHFARFGGTVARSVTGRTDVTPSIEEDARESFRAASEGRQLSSDAYRSLEARCIGFLRSDDPDDAKLRFYFTQGFYLTQLLGLDQTQFNPIAEAAFKDAVFFIDTNVLIPRLLGEPERAANFDEVIVLAERLGIRLVVTKATIDEARKSAALHIESMKGVVERVPKELSSQTEDAFMLSFLRQLETNPKLVPDDLMAPFDDLRDLLNSLNIEIDEREADEIVAKRNISHVAEVITEAARKSDGRSKKSQTILLHDVAHHLAVTDARKKGARAWFLTRDQSLLRAGPALAAEGELSFCFSIVAFLQSISPHVASKAEAESLVGIFAKLVESPHLTGGSKYDMEELKLIAEYHEDVLATPPDKLVRAFDYVKKEVLQGKPYEMSSLPRVALEIKKYLNQGAQEKEKSLLSQAEALRAQTAKQAATIEAEREEKLRVQNALSARTQALEYQGETLGRVVGEKSEIERRLAEAEAARAASEAARAASEAALAKQATRTAWVLAAAGALLGAIGLLSERFLTVTFGDWLGVLNRTPITATLNLAFGSLVVIPTGLALRKTNLAGETRMGILTVVAALVIAFSKVVTDADWGNYSAYVQIASLIAALVFTRRSGPGE